MTDIIERLQGDAIEVIERLRRELADAKRPPNGTVPSATHAEHKRYSHLRPGEQAPALNDLLQETEEVITLTVFVDNDQIDADREAERLHLAMAEMIRRAYEAGQEAGSGTVPSANRPIPTIICGNCGCKFPLSATTYCPGCGIQEVYGE